VAGESDGDDDSEEDEHRLALRALPLSSSSLFTRSL